MGIVLVAGGVIGSLAGSFLFRALQKMGQIDIAISAAYVLLLGSVGGMMLTETVPALRAARAGKLPPPRPRHNPQGAALPFRWRVYRYDLFISPPPPIRPWLC